jgi:hypothetical protein
MFAPPTNEDVAEVRALGVKVIGPLAAYLYLEHKDDFTQLYAVRLLVAIGGPSTFNPLKRAFGTDQWEEVRAEALDGMSRALREGTKPYVDTALKDKSQIVRLTAQYLLTLYQGQRQMSGARRHILKGR